MEILALIWFIIGSVVKFIIYVTYFIPLLVARGFQYIDFWPTLWPFSPLI
jgi:hypothetical protein